MRRFKFGGFGLVLALLGACGALAGPAATPGPQEANGYTRYELLAPGSGKFRIVYDITAIRPGATAFFNPIRKGSVASDETVTDRATGKPLKFKVVSGDAAKTSGLPDADPTYDYIRVQLARPVPQDGEGRIRIEKTYEDSKSYYQDGDTIIFDRSLGITRDAVVLPQGYGLVDCNYPVQVEQEADGRIKVSFINNTPAEAPLKLTARPMKLSAATSSVHDRLGERAAQTRDIVYFLREPATHTFDLYHDYTEERPGTSRYVNVVRPGSAASNPSARNLDTGEILPAQILKGDAITKAGISDPDLPTITPDSEVVVFNFKPLKPGQSIRLRMSETYTDPGRYTLVGDELVFDRSFGRPANAVVLPQGWMLTNSTIPAQITTTADGRVRLDFINARPDEIAVLITARKAE
ncbi:MAG TPA: hypothetical protein VHU87_13490 [Rhizomicrobium sp.]|jgi:hypothetical protein|nr:hypothetical protein [Rhizomicrobium sp.]